MVKEVCQVPINKKTAKTQKKTFELHEMQLLTLFQGCLDISTINRSFAYVWGRN